LENIDVQYAAIGYRMSPNQILFGVSCAVCVFYKQRK
jgi:hypothetical protein